MWLFDFRRYALAFKMPIRTAHGPWPTREGLIIRLTSAQGQNGYGEVAPVPGFRTESLDEAEAICRGWGQRISAAQVDAVPASFGCLRFALASAREELNPTIASAHPFLPVAALLPSGRGVLSAIAGKGDAGFRTFKWKVGVGDVADELSLLDDLIGELPNGSRLRLDANGAWDRRQAERWLERCADRPIEYIEQPIAPDFKEAEDLLMGLAGDFPTAIGLDESLVMAGDVDHWVELGWPGIFVLKPALLGGEVAALDRLRKSGAKVVFSSVLETSVGARAALRIAFSFGGESRALGFGVWPLFERLAFDGPVSAPFIRTEDVDRLNPQEIWNALN